jgi:O-acetyl-ADP-ribose deacetylase (regulator of RNase III)
MATIMSKPIQFIIGNIFDAPAEALVNAVNTVGVMGAGIALQFKHRFPNNFNLYFNACKAGEVEVGKMFVTEIPEASAQKWVINFPTKKDWRDPSNIEWIREGLKDLRRIISEKEIKSVAIPALGAGLGGLEWAEVKAAIEQALDDMVADIMVYAPRNSETEPPAPHAQHAYIAELLRGGISSALKRLEKVKLEQLRRIYVALGKFTGTFEGVSPERLQQRISKLRAAIAEKAKERHSKEGA